MSIVAIACVQEGIAVAADSRSSTFDSEGHFLSCKDDSLKIASVKKYNMFFTLCGCPRFTDKENKIFEFQQYIDRFIEEFENYIKEQDKEPRLKFLIEYFKDYTYYYSGFTECSVYIAGYDIYDELTYVVKYSKEENSLYDIEGNWCLKNLNGIPTDAQNILVKEMLLPSYGFDVSGVSQFIEKKYKLIKIGNEEIEINKHTPLNRAIEICRYAVEYTIESLERNGYVPVCGGPISIFSIRNPKFCPSKS